jgi:hypothetical protein
LSGKFYYFQQPKEVRLEVLTMAIVNVLVFCDVTPYELVDNHQLFEIAFCPMFGVKSV